MHSYLLDGSKLLDFNEFRKGMQELGLGLSLSDAELKLVFNYFDKDRAGAISYDEFIVAIRV